MSVMAKTVSASSGTARMSRISRRVKPMEPAPIIAILMGMVFLLASIVLLASNGETMLPDFDKLWDYQHPAETETKFVELLPAAEKSRDVSYLAQLLTQLARAQGLQEKFDEAIKTLNRAVAITRDD